MVTKRPLFFETRRRFVHFRQHLKQDVRLASLRARVHLEGALGLPGALEDVKVYESMRADNAVADSEFTAGRFWNELNREFALLIYSGALANLRNEYFNRRFAAYAPDDPVIYRSLLWIYYQRLVGLDETGYLRRASDPAHGGTRDQVEIEGRPVSLDFLQSVEEAFAIREAWRLAGRTGDPRLIVELGAGYGRLANVCRDLFPSCTYVILDLPEALSCSAHWLARVRPGEVVPYADSRELAPLSRETLCAKKIWTLGAQRITDIADSSVDAFVNVYSFAEMRPESVQRYFKEIERTTSGILFSKQRKYENNVEDRVVLSAESYPVPKQWRPLYERTTTVLQDFFEAAYECVRAPAR